jgi:hypothetical protein
MKIFASLVLSAVCAAAATPAEIDTLIAAARELPAEFAADSLLRLASLDQVDAPRRIELIRQAFEKGAQAQQPYKRHSILNLGQVTLPFQNKAYQQDLDALSLELRAVDAMLAADPAQARGLFLRIPALQLAPLKCPDVLAFDVDHFYQTLASLAARSFTAKEKAAGEPYRFVARYAGAIQSAVQAGPMADVIAGWDGSDTDFTALLSAYGAALGKIHGDDRSFSYAQKLGTRIEALVSQCKRRKVSPLPLLETYRLYLVVHLSASRCADDDRVGGGGTTFGMVTSRDAGQPVSSPEAFFNEKLRMDPLQPIQEIESTPSRLEGEASVMPACQEAACKAIVGRYRELIVGPGGQPLRPADRATPEWHSKLETILSDLKKWSPGNASNPDFFRDKAALYNDLLNLAPPGRGRNAVLRGALEFVLAGREQAASRIEWFLPLNGLLARTVLDPIGFGPFAAEMRNSSDPVVALYARLEAVAPRPPDRVIGLL